MAIPPYRPAPAAIFARAWNSGNMEEVEGLLAVNATATVIDAGFPLEVGRAQIASTSLPHLRSGGATTARSAETEGVPLVLLSRAEDDKIECILRLTVERGLISRIEYLTVPHARSAMVEIAEPMGLTVLDA